MERNIFVTKDSDNNNIVFINEIVFKGKRKIDWNNVRDYLKRYIGKVYEMLEK